MHNPESVQQNERHQIFWDFEIQMDHLISARWPNLVIVYKNKKKTSRAVVYSVSALKETEKKVSP